MTGKCHAYILQLDGALKVRPAVASLDSGLVDGGRVLGSET